MVGSRWLIRWQVACQSCQCRLATHCYQQSLGRKLLEISEAAWLLSPPVNGSLAALSFCPYLERKYTNECSSFFMMH